MSKECQVCGHHFPNAMNRHHLIPRRYGGSDDDDNVVTLCANCHTAIEQLYNRSFWEKARSIPDHKFNDLDAENVGRPEKLGAELKSEVLELYEMGVNYSSIARVIESKPDGPESISSRTIRRYCQNSSASFE